MRSNSTAVVAALFLACTFVPATSLFAQQGDGGSGDGLWWSVVAAAGGIRLTCDLCDTDRDLGPAVGVSVGAYAGPAVRVGVDGGVWTRTDGDIRETVYDAGFVAAVHPRPQSGFHLLGGLGWTGYRAEDFRYDAVRMRLGAGWDLPLARGWVVGNRVTLDAASFGTLHSGDAAVVESVGLSVVRFGLYVRHR